MQNNSKATKQLQRVRNYYNVAQNIYKDTQQLQRDTKQLQRDTKQPQRDTKHLQRDKTTTKRHKTSTKRHKKNTKGHKTTTKRHKKKITKQLQSNATWLKKIVMQWTSKRYKGTKWCISFSSGASCTRGWGAFHMFVPRGPFSQNLSMARPECYLHGHIPSWQVTLKMNFSLP